MLQSQLLSGFWRRTMPEPQDGKDGLQAMLHHHSSPSLNGAAVGNAAAAAYTAVTIPPEVPAVPSVPAVPGAPVLGEICLLTESPFRILRVSGWRGQGHALPLHLAAALAGSQSPCRASAWHQL